MENKKEKLTIAQIESIEFFRIGGYWPYKLKKVEILGPNQNVAGLIMIDGNYYNEVFIKSI